MPEEMQIVGPPSKPAKPGRRTSEFWVTSGLGGFAVLDQAFGFLPQPWGLVCATVLGATYNISRGLAKK